MSSLIVRLAMLPLIALVLTGGAKAKDVTLPIQVVVDNSFITLALNDRLTSFDIDVSCIIGSAACPVRCTETLCEAVVE